MRESRERRRWRGAIAIAAVVVVAVIVGACSNPTNSETYTYEVGDTGPAGGTIFYDDEADGTDDIAGARYLEAAPGSTEWNNVEWGGDGTDINGDDSTVAPELDGIGDGQANTTAILNALDDNGGTDYPAKLADDLVHNGYTDWFLPSKDELNQMYLQRVVIGGFASAGYWSSSEGDADVAWFQNFGNGYQTGYSKNFGHRVRAVRAF